MFISVIKSSAVSVDEQGAGFGEVSLRQVNVYFIAISPGIGIGNILDHLFTENLMLKSLITRLCFCYGRNEQPNKEENEKKHN
jgi:hypothetical protein